MPIARLILALSLFAALMAVGSDLALAAWLPPVAATGTEARVEDPQVAIDGDGNTTLVWTSGEAPNRSIRSAFRPAGGGWEPAFNRMTSTFDCHHPRLAVNAAGAAALVAECEKPSPGVRAAYRPASSWNGSLEIAGSANGNAPRVGIAANGDADAAWAGPSSTVVASHRPASGSWSSGAQISPVGKESLEPNLAVSPAGYAHAIWRESRAGYAGDPVVEVKASRRSPGTSGTWTEPFRLSANFGPGSTTPVAIGEPQISIGVNGQRMMAWSQQGTDVVMAERTSGGDLFGINEPIVFLTESGNNVEDPRIAVDGTGRGVVGWRSDEGGFFPIRAATTGLINGNWSGPTTVSGPTTGSTTPSVAIDPAGRATVIWLAGGSVWAATRPTGGTFPSLSPTVISSTAQPGFQGPTVTTTASGDAIAAWSAAATRIAVAVDDVTPPTLAATVPASAGVDETVAMSATASDAWSAPSVHWDFGDGTSASGAAASHVYASPGTRAVTVTAADAAGNTTTATRTVTVAAAPAPPRRVDVPKPAKPVVLKLKLPKQSWAAIRRAGAVKVKCRLDVAGRCVGKPKLKGKPAGRQRSVKAPAKRFAVLKLKLKAPALKAIEGATAPVSLKIEVTAKAPGRTDVRATKTLRIPR